MSPLEKAAIAYTGKWRDGVHIDNGFGTAQRMWESMGAAQKESHLAALRAALEALMPPEADSVELDNMPWSGIVNTGHEAASKAGFAIGDADWYAPRHIFEAMLRKVLEP
jgi:hypothetical protein